MHKENNTTQEQNRTLPVPRVRARERESRGENNVKIQKYCNTNQQSTEENNVQFEWYAVPPSINVEMVANTHTVYLSILCTYTVKLI